MHDVYNLFLISGGINDLVARPLQVFLAKDFEMAKLYFRGYTQDDNRHFNLYQIGEIGKNLKVINKKIFIDCKRKNNNNDNNFTIKQQKFEFEKHYENEKETNAEIIQRLFEGKYVE